MTLSKGNHLVKLDAGGKPCTFETSVEYEVVSFPATERDLVAGEELVVLILRKVR